MNSEHQPIFPSMQEETSAPSPWTPPTYFIGRGKPTPTTVYNTYWKFAAIRQETFFNRINHPRSGPWSDDPVLQSFKFTNAYRSADRVSQYLIKNVIYDGEQTPDEVFFRIILFKLFNKIETWEVLKNQFGTIKLEGFDWVQADKTLTDLLDNGQRVYSAAYIMASPSSAFGQKRKHSNHLKLLARMVDERVALRIQQCDSMATAYEIMLSYPGIGPFLAYQYVIDINYSTITNFSENDFVVPGPGALSGISKIFTDLGSWSPEDVIQYVTDEQENELQRLGIEFKTLWGRNLHLIDCQNLFCEVDKYSRIVHPEFSGNGGRTRIKQVFKPIFNTISYWFPPKWGINDKVTKKTSDDVL